LLLVHVNNNNNHIEEYRNEIYPYRTLYVANRGDSWTITW
jgi:hypothetical protein